MRRGGMKGAKVFGLSLLHRRETWGIHTPTFLGSLFQIGEVVGISRANFEKGHIEFMKKFYRHLKPERENEGFKVTASSQAPRKCTLGMKQSLPHLVHPRGREEDPHLPCICLQLLILLVTKLQVTLVLAIRRPPGVFAGVRSLQSSFVELVLQFTLLEFGTIGTTVLSR